MLHLGLYQSNLSISIVEDHDPSTLIIQDKSEYMETPDFPVVDIYSPGAIQSYTLPVEVGSQTIANSRLLGLGVTGPLPDGVYRLRFSIVPSDKAFLWIHYLKTHTLEQRLDSYILAHQNMSVTEKKRFFSDYTMIQVLLRAARELASQKEDQKATELYRKALDITEHLCS